VASIEGDELGTVKTTPNRNRLITSLSTRIRSVAEKNSQGEEGPHDGDSSRGLEGSSPDLDDDSTKEVQSKKAKGKRERKTKNEEAAAALEAKIVEYLTLQKPCPTKPYL